MAADRRSVFARKWFQRGLRARDPFDQFFSLWIALVVSAQRHRTLTGRSFGEDDGDRDKVLDYLTANSDKVFQALQENRERMATLARRRGSRHASPIVDTGSAELREKFSQLAGHYAGHSVLSQRDLAEAVGKLFNKVRNNVFHGIKVYDDRSDIELLQLVNPVLATILRKCESV